MADLGRQRYVSITTFRADGSPVATPVWIVAHGSLLYVWTGAHSGKEKRIRRNPEVTLAPCTFRGEVTGPAVPARAQVVPSADRADVWPAFQAKYGLQLRATLLSGRISRLFQRGRPAGDRVFLELTLAGG
jgi:uncharacterized protein